MIVITESPVVVIAGWTWAYPWYGKLAPLRDSLICFRDIRNTPKQMGQYNERRRLGIRRGFMRDRESCKKTRFSTNRAAEGSCSQLNALSKPNCARRAT